MILSDKVLVTGYEAGSALIYQRKAREGATTILAGAVGAINKLAEGGRRGIIFLNLFERDFNKY